MRDVMLFIFMVLSQRRFPRTPVASSRPQLTIVIENSGEDCVDKIAKDFMFHRKSEI
jgi:hypothetical protein